MKNDGEVQTLNTLHVHLKHSPITQKVKAILHLGNSWKFRINLAHFQAIHLQSTHAAF